jgi:poly(hydroxyalkanoate) depolymerase family esterase
MKKTFTKHLLLFFVWFSFSTEAQSLLQKMPFSGKNLGNLEAYIHLPKNPQTVKNRPLVVVLHGCNQTALAIARQSGWCELADEYNFLTIFPQQKASNNPNLCFNWFRENDAHGDKGEASSVREMIEFAQKEYGTDPKQVFVYGVSAGAMLSASLLTMYPTEFKAGAVLAGGPFVPGQKATERMKSLTSKNNRQQTDWVGPVKNYLPNTQQWPQLVVLHGQKDLVVSPENATMLVQQWLTLNELVLENKTYSSGFAANELVDKTVYRNADGMARVILYEFADLGHALPVDPGNLPNQGGQTGFFAVDKNFFSTYYIAQDWGLIPF